MLNEEEKYKENRVIFEKHCPNGKGLQEKRVLRPDHDTDLLEIFEGDENRKPFHTCFQGASLPNLKLIETVEIPKDIDGVSMSHCTHGDSSCTFVARVYVYTDEYREELAKYQSSGGDDDEG